MPYFILLTFRSYVIIKYSSAGNTTIIRGLSSGSFIVLRSILGMNRPSLGMDHRSHLRRSWTRLESLPTILSDTAVCDRSRSSKNGSRASRYTFARYVRYLIIYISCMNNYRLLQVRATSSNPGATPAAPRSALPSVLMMRSHFDNPVRDRFKIKQRYH